ncbi:hypothetical protein BVRB_023000, partial [Beta vulgaris subsp. vulgaris]
PVLSGTMSEEKHRPYIPIQTRDEAVAALAARDALREARNAERKVNVLSQAMEETSLEDLRRARLAELQAKAGKVHQWRANGHGAYSEVADQRAWFDATKTSERVITHFYRPTTPFCELVDKHLSVLAANHIEARFIRINAEKAPFLADRLNIVTIPTIVMTSDGTVKDRIIGFEGIAKLDKCSSEDFERRLALNGMIDYDGDPRGKSTGKE